MRLLAALLATLLLSAFALPTASNVTLAPAVSSTVYNDLVFYLRYASSVYATTACVRPNGNTLVTQINDIATDTQGFVARDDTRREIVVVLRGSSSLTDFLTDASILLVPMSLPGTRPSLGVLVHAGFQTAWRSVATAAISAVRAQLAAHPDYTIVTSGHSLGGALSSLAGITLKENFPNSPLRLYTYGQPRTGNPAYASFVNSRVGASNIFRGVHTTDGVPTIIPTYFGYAHHSTEYWQTIDPGSAATVRQCSAGGEDLTCSAIIPSGGINAAHLTYYNIPLSTPFCI